MAATSAFPVLLTEIAGQAVVELAQRFGTPLFVYDAAVIAARIAELRAFDVVRYAQKALSTLGVLDLMRRQGARVDCVSAGEVHRALAAGWRPGQSMHPPEIVYTADIFDRQSLELVLEHDIHVNCGSPDMIDQYGERAPGRAITLRVNPGFGHGHSQKTNTGGTHSKHGIWHEQLEDVIERAAKYDLSITGLHMHIGSGTDMEHLGQVCGAMEKAALVIGSSIQTISAGGGLPVPYHDGEARVDVAAYFDLWNATRHRLAGEFGHEITLEIEPGRYVAAESGFLVAEIRTVKSTGENRFYLVDAGFNNLARPILYGAYHPIAVCPQVTGTFSPQPGSAAPEGSIGEKVPVTLQDVVVGGPLCESGDIFTQQFGGTVERRTLPEATVGDYLVFGCAGAYGAVMGSNYNSKPLAAEVLIENGQAQLIRRRQTLDELVQDETIPQHG